MNQEKALKTPEAKEEYTCCHFYLKISLMNVMKSGMWNLKGHVLAASMQEKHIYPEIDDDTNLKCAIVNLRNVEFYYFVVFCFSLCISGQKSRIMVIKTSAIIYKFYPRKYSSTMPTAHCTKYLIHNEQVWTCLMGGIVQWIPSWTSLNMFRGSLRPGPGDSVIVQLYCRPMHQR